MKYWQAGNKLDWSHVADVDVIVDRICEAII